MNTHSTQLANTDAITTAPGWRPASRGLVFLSHSSRIRQESELRPGDSLRRHTYRKKYLRQLLSCLDEQLDAAGFPTWLDRLDMGEGENFDTLIYDALGRCQAAVILIDRDALDSDYVRKEVTILHWRKVVGDSIYLLPVLLGDVTDEDLRESELGRQTGIDSLIPLRPADRKANSMAAQSTAEAITHALADATVGWEDADSPNHRWIDDVSLFLSEASPGALQRAARRIGVDDHAWHQAERKRQAIAAALLSCDARTAYKVLQDIVHQLEPDRAKKTIERSLPLWVDLQAARIVMSANDLAVDDRVVGLSSRAYRLGVHLAQRATACAPEYPVLPVPDVTGEETIEELLDRYDRTLRDLLSISHNATLETLAGYLDLSSGIYVIMRCDSLTARTAQAVMAGLHQRFPGIVIVVLAGTQHPVWRQSHIRQAYDPFTRTQENDARWYVSAVSRLVRKTIKVDSDE